MDTRSKKRISDTSSSKDNQAGELSKLDNGSKDDESMDEEFEFISPAKDPSELAKDKDDGSMDAGLDLSDDDQGPVLTAKKKGNKNTILGSDDDSSSEDTMVEFHECMNSYIELHGTHRFKNDPAFGEVMLRWRNGEMTKEDVDLLNTRVVKDDTELPEDMRYATYRNVDRASINSGLFQAYLKNLKDNDLPMDCVVVFASELRVKKGKNVWDKQDNAFEEYFFKACTEAHTSVPESVRNGRFDPALCLWFDKQTNKLND